MKRILSSNPAFFGTFRIGIRIRMKKYVILLILCVCLLTSCGKAQQDLQEKTQAEIIVNWRETGFVASEEVSEEQGLWVQECILWDYDDYAIDPETEVIVTDEDLSHVRANNGKIYRVNTVRNHLYADPIRWIIDELDTETMESRTREITFDQLGQEKRKNTYAYMVGMDVVDDEEFVFQWIEIEKNEQMMFRQTVNRMIYSNLSTRISAIDLLDIYLQREVVPDEIEEQLVIPQGYCVCDSDGNTYARASKSENGYTKLLVFDRTGQVTLEYHCNEKQEIGDPMRMDTGEIVVPVHDSQEKIYFFLWADTSGGQMREVGRLNCSEQIEKFYGAQGNFIYYMVKEGIIRWDIGRGDRILIFNFRENGIPMGYDSLLIFRRDKPPILRMNRGNGKKIDDWLVILSESKIERDNDIRIVDISSDNLGNKQVSECAALTARQDWNHLYTYEGCGENKEDFRTKVMAELVAGGGPDILYVSPEDMEILWEKGVLADLREFLPQTSIDIILPGVLQMGTRGGRFLGLAGNVMVLGMVVDKDVWNRDTWKLEDLIALMENGELEGSIYYAGTDSYFAPLASQRILTEYCLNNASLIDWEEKKSHFQEDTYIKFLDITNRAGKPAANESENWLNNGRRVVFYSISSEEDIAELVLRVQKENGTFIGFPTDGFCGNYLETKGMLVVNANSDKKEEISRYLDNFLGADIQGLCKKGIYQNLSICKNSFADENLGETESLLAKKFLESCVPAPRQYPELNRIIEEELGAMAAGDKDARQVAEIIHKRVQMYLDEK